MVEIIHTIGDVSYLLLSYITDISSRLCLIYFIPAVVMSFFATARDDQRIRDVLVQRWLGRSAWQDYGWISLNAVLKVTVYGHIALLGIDLAQWSFHTLDTVFGSQVLGIDPLTLMIVYTISHTLLDDLSVYVLHRYMHSSSLLWSFHSVHHSATSLTPLTWLRIHPIETILNTTRKVIIYGLVTGCFMFLSSSFVTKVTYLGVNILSLVFFIMGANLRHSHIPFSYGSLLENIFISPLQHQIHHSSDKKHLNHNFGSKFAVWDWLFGTLIKSKEINVPLKYGLNDRTDY